MYTLGDITFDGVQGFESMQVSREAVYAEIPLLNSRPVLQKTGEALRNVNVSIAVHADYADPDEVISVLDDYRSKGTVSSLANGDGVYLGKFVIVSIDETVVKALPTGKTYAARVSLQLREYFDPSDVDERSESEEFAVGALSSVVLNTSSSPHTGEIQAVTAEGVGKADAIGGVVDVELASDQQESEKQLKQADRGLFSARKSYEKLRSIAALYPNVRGKVSTIISRSEQIVQNIDNVRDSIALGDLTNAIANSDNLLESVIALDGEMLPLRSSTILRI